MVANNRESLDEGIVLSKSSKGDSLGVQEVRVGEGIPHEFIYDYNDYSPPLPGNIDELCLLYTFLGDAVQYQQTRDCIMTPLLNRQGS